MQSLNLVVFHTFQTPTTVLGGVEYAISDDDGGAASGDIKGLGHLVRDTLRLIR